MAIYRGGHPTYGQAVGVLMLDTRFPRIPGDIGNAATFPFPVVYKVVQGASPKRVHQVDPALIEPFIGAARELEDAGVRAITTSCGFLAIFQKEIAGAVRVPVISSSLMQVPMVHRLVGHRTVGILTGNEAALTERHFNGVGWSSRDIPIVVRGLEKEVFSRVHHENWQTADFGQMDRDMVGAARQMVAERPDVAAIVLECTNMPPHSASVEEAVDRPVFSIVTLVNMVYAGLPGCGSTGEPLRCR